MKFKIGNIQQYVDVELAYSITQTNEKVEFFICTVDILNDYNLTAKQFIKFLQQDLPTDDPCYNSAFELWVSNKGIHSKTNLTDSSQPEIQKVSRIFTADEVIEIKN